MRMNQKMNCLEGAERLIEIALGALEQANEPELLEQVRELHAALRSRCFDLWGQELTNEAKPQR